MEKCAEVYGMTNEEKAIVMAYTGTCMLIEDKFKIFHEYVEKLMGRPIYTHELGFLADEIKEKAKDDFIGLCKEDTEQTSELDKTLDKIREEIEALTYYCCEIHPKNVIDDVLKIIDKYRKGGAE